jgi:HicA toxin of bacterial toxin-antitoxin,
MSQLEKLKERLKRKPKDFTWDELKKLLHAFGYELLTQGKTGGSRRRFVHSSGSVISLHKPHPENILKRYLIEQLLEILAEENFL